MVSFATESGGVREQFNTLHARFIAGDATAAGEIFELVSSELAPRLRSRVPRDQDLADSAIDDALLKYFLDPHRYDPLRGHPIAWFASIVWRRICDYLRSNNRRRCSEASFDRQVPQTVAMSSGESERQVFFNELRCRFLELARTPEEGAFAEAWLNGADRRTFVRLLQLESESPQWQSVQIQRMKTRLRKRAHASNAYLHRD